MTARAKPKLALVETSSDRLTAIVTAIPVYGVGPNAVETGVDRIYG